MSYILDALKKAEQERKRGKTPDFMTEHEDREDKPKKRSWLYALLALVVAAAGSAGWFLGSDNYQSVPVKPQQTAQVAMNAPEQPQPAVQPSAEPSSEITPLTQQTKTAETAAPAKEVISQTEKQAAGNRKDVTPQADRNSRIKKAVSVADRGRPSQEKPDAKEPTTIKTAVPGNRIYSISELPDEIRQGLPALSISTHIYSQEKSERLASINGHIGREGQEIMSGIILESVTHDGAILRYQGYRFKVNLK